MKHLALLSSVLAAALLIGGCSKKKSPAVEAVTVAVAQPEIHKFRDGIRTQGLIVPIHRATVSANIPGKIEELSVKEGDQVKAGDVLFRSDRKNLENARILAAEAVKVAQERVKTREADVANAQLAYDKAKLDYDRSEKLFRSQAVSATAREATELKYKQAKLAIEQARAAQATALAEVGFTSAALAIAEKKLADSIVTAPYDGVITAKLRNVDEFCDAGTPVVKIEDPRAMRVEVVLSAVHFQQVSPGKTHVAINFGGKELAKIPVTQVNGAIDAASRTFVLKADLPADGNWVSGLLCDVTVIFDERESFCVPENAVLFRAKNGFQVFLAVDGKAKGFAVTPGVTAQGFTETPELGNLPAAQVIVSGQYFVNEETPVKILTK